MENVLRIWGGSFHDYWFADDAVLRVRLVSRLVTVIGIVVLIVLTGALGIIGVALGALVAVVIYIASRNMARRRRIRISTLTVSEAQRRGLVTLRIPYSVISAAELDEGHLTLHVEGRRVRLRVEEENVQQLRSLLRDKLRGSFTTSNI